jgi:hypothetical protein
MKPFRRRKGKTGPYVGNYRCTYDGRDVNLRTKDANEAVHRAKLLKQGKWDGRLWPPTDAAVDAAVRSLDPGASPDPLATVPVETGGGGEAAPATPPANHPEPPPPPRETSSHDPERPPLHEAMREAATEASGAPERTEAATAEQQNAADGELRSIMAELGSTADGQGDLLSGLADGAAAFALWAEGKAIEWGINWSLARRRPPTKVRFQAGQIDERSLMRRALRVGIKASVVTYFPDFANQLTPPMAIAIGLIGGAVTSVVEGQLVNPETGEVTKASKLVDEAAQAARSSVAGPTADSNSQPAAATPA